MEADILAGNDLAVLRLDAALSIAPKRWASSPPAVGDAIHIVGFGWTEPGSGGVLGLKHAGDAFVTELGDRIFAAEGDSWTCVGDSGGPALRTARDEIAGITSTGPRGCRVSTSYYTRVDVHAALIADFLGIEVPATPVSRASPHAHGALRRAVHLPRRVSRALGPRARDSRDRPYAEVVASRATRWCCHSAARSSPVRR